MRVGDKQTIISALVDAIGDRESYLDAWDIVSGEKAETIRVETKNRIESYKELLKRMKK